MKARLPKGYGTNGGASNLQQLARQAQKMQAEMDEANQQLEEKEYTATAGGAVTATVTGKFEIKSLDIKKEAVDPEDVEVLSDRSSVRSMRLSEKPVTKRLKQWTRFQAV